MFSRARAAVSIVGAFVLGVSLLSTVSTPAQGVGEDSGGVFVPVTPTRIADTNAGTNTPATPLGTGARAFWMLGVGGIPASGVSAVVLDVSITSATANTSLYASPTGGVEASSFLKAGPSQVPTSNTIIVKPGSSGRVTFRNSAGASDINVDVQGYFTTGSDANSTGGFTPVTPTRVVGTNVGIGLPQAKLIGGHTYEVQIAGNNDIPADAKAIFANVRVLDATTDGGVRILASGDTATSAFAVNYDAGSYNDTGMSIKLGTNGKIKITPSSTVGSQLDLIIDVQGYFSGNSAEGGSFTPLTNSRIYDSRNYTKIAAGEIREIPATGIAGVPADGSVGAVAMTVLALNWTASGSVKIFNPDTGADGTSNIAFKTPFATVGATSTSIIAISDEGTIDIQNLTTGPVDILLDAQGWFSRIHPLVVEAPDHSDLADDGVFTSAPQTIESATQSHVLSFPSGLPSNLTPSFDSVSQFPVVRNTSNQIVGRFEAVVLDAADVEVPSTMSVSGANVVVTVSLTASPNYPFYVVPGYVGSDDFEEDE